MAAADVRRPVSIAADANALAIGMLIYLMASRLVWYHYLVLTAPALLSCVRAAMTTNDRPLRGMYFVTVAWCLILLGTDPVSQWLDLNSLDRLLASQTAHSLLLALCVLNPPRQ